MSDRSRRIWTLLCIAAAGLYGVARLELNGSIMHFLPSRVDAELIRISLDLLESPLSRRMVLSIEGGEDPGRVAKELAGSLREHEEVAWVEAGFDPGTMRSLYELYFDRRVYLASANPEVEIPKLLASDALARRADHLLARLAAPDGMLVARVAPEDPLGLFDAVLARVQDFQPGASRAAASGDPPFALVQLGLRSSPFDSLRQVGLLTFIESEFERIAAEHGGGFLLEQSGANRFAVASEKSVRGDVNFISLVSLSVVFGLFLLIFHSLRNLLIAIIVPIGGFAFALAASLALSDAVHDITLAFGFVLIGVAIDYPIHLMNHHALTAGAGSAWQAVASIRPSLVVSAVTTTLAFFSLFLSDFPGLSEMGTFAAIGVPIALGLTLFCLPAFLTRPPVATPAQRALSLGSVRLVDRLSERPALLVGVLCVFAAIAAIGIPRLQWEDDPSGLMTMDPVLLAEARRVSDKVGEFDPGRFVVGLAPDRESALVLNERIAERLTALVDSGQIGGIGSLSSFLLSEDLQQRNLAAFRDADGLEASIDTAFGAAGFRPGAFAAFAQSIDEPAAPPLRPDDLIGTPLERALASLVEVDGHYSVVTLLRGVDSGAVVSAALEGLDGAHYVDQKAIMSDVYQGYRRSTVRMLGVGAVVVLVVLQLRYRHPLRGLLAALPAGLGALATFGLFGLLDSPVNVVSAISALVVLGMGVDYGIFAVDSARDHARQGAMLTSLMVSCLTSVFVFGVLALASQPVLRSIGLTTGVGVLLALALAPVTLALARRL